MTFSEWLDTALKVGGVVGGIVSAGIALFLRSARRGLATKAEVEKVRADLQGRLDTIDRRLGSVETEMRHLPTDEDIAKLVDRIGKVEGSVQAVAVQVEGVNALVARVDREVGRLIDFHMKEPAR
ncbi:DUF2730 family protein [Nitrospirillum viridazoti]|uniref:Uncharacterized protein DUF2730 n=1 Tax=Nitrospirillum amazonense TaxID=28077 RepID=A0A560IKH1_9PROT|nr:DUF2730 family protein [Nitrospirillum amazonense]TWB58695.1 uncharacterized protein DUF2730 [Nitrospirillum amazonense]